MPTSTAPLLAQVNSGPFGPPSPPLDEPAILGLIDAVVYDWDLTTDVLKWGANARRVFKDFPEEALRTGAAFAQYEASAGASRAALFVAGKSADASQGAPYQTSFVMRSPDGARLEISDFGRWCVDASGRPVRAHGLLRVEKLEREPPLAAPPAEALRSGPVTRQELTALIEARAKTEGFVDGRFAVAAIGVDDLERFNALWGFQAGDELLDAVAGRIARSLRSTDAYARHAGASFVAQVALGDKDKAEMTAQRLAERLNQGSYALNGLAAKATVRVGLAMGTRTGRSADGLIRRAFDSLELARAQGAPSACFDESEAKRLRLRQEAEDLARLDRAIAAGAFELAYQPIVPLSPGLPLIHEALARLVDGDGATARPAEWLNLAERHGRIEAIDRIVLQAAIAKLLARPELTTAVNVSPITLRDPSFVAMIRGALLGRPQIARRLVVEIVETAAIHDVDSIGARFADLRAAGVRLAMDDFGAGHTSLRNLRALKVEIVKIDGAFVQNIARSSDDRFFVRELIALARRIGAKVVAEWVEDAETLSLLRKWGCDYAQGNFLGAPALDVAADELAAASGA